MTEPVLTREEFLEQSIWELITNEEHSLWPDEDGNGYDEPRSVVWRCGCEEDSANKWNGPAWTQTDPQCTGQPTLDEVLHAWFNHIRYERSLLW